MNVSFQTVRLKFGTFAILVFWYVALYPGRLGFDYAELARMIRRGESTAWWGATYFWFFKWFTFNTNTIAVISGIGLLVLVWSLHHFVQNLPLNSIRQRNLFLILISTPLVGVFGMTVSHDVFQTSGIIFLTSLILKKTQQQTFQTVDKISYACAGVCLTTTQYGILIFIFCSLYFLRIYTRLILFSVSTVLILYFAANAGISKEDKSIAHLSNSLPRMLLIDLKCIAQHPQAEITSEEWKVLYRYAPNDLWKAPVPCSSPDLMAASLNLDSQVLQFDLKLLKAFLNIVSRQPAIPFMSHVQRSSVALPPPFFQPPPNQISWDVNQPIGIKTNVALQEGPELLHPSIDDVQLAKRPTFLRPLEMFALLPAFVINQASWFWGWGGFWLWPMIYLFVYRVKTLTFRQILQIFTPTLTLHSIIFLVGPTSLGRYVMSTILLGFTCLVAVILPRGNSRSDT